MASRPVSPVEPTKRHIQPNAHPYAIKTTSSALLSRSNSSPHSAHHARHHYTPSPPSWAQAGTRTRHRHSSSLPSIEGEMCPTNGVLASPAPLPTPPLNAVVASSCDLPMPRADELEHSRRIRRAETLPSNATQSIKKTQLQDSTQDPYTVNPKQWNTDQLTIYLETSLKSDNAVNQEDLAGILDCVRKRGLTGRELLRLTDADLAGTPLSDLQRAWLFERSRTLRANVLRGRTHVNSYHSHEVSDDLYQVYSHSTRASAPSHSIRGASMSVDDLHLLLGGDAGEGGSAFPPSPVVSLHRSNSVSDASAQRYRDLARMRMRRRGKVKCLVETWERTSTSGSECSASDAESESEADLKFESNSDVKGPSEPSIDFPSTLQESLDVRSPVEGPSVLQEPLLSTPPPPYTHVHSSLGATQAEEEEPTIEELLASSSDIPLRGARAWEADFILGETVKRVPTFASADVDARITELDPSCHLRDDTQCKNASLGCKESGTRQSTGSGGKDASLKTRGRVVTAIFTGSLSDDLSEDAGSKDRCHADGENVVSGEAPASSESQDDPDHTLQALEESIAGTRTQLEAFRLRLERVEADIARQEATFIHPQCSDSFRHPLDHELKHRRPEANERGTAELMDPVENNPFLKRSSNKDVPGDWQSMTLADVARAIVARTVGWLFPYGHLGVCDKSRVWTAGGNDSDRSLATRNGRFPVARMSCNIILVSFAICAAVLRKIGFGRWARRP